MSHNFAKNLGNFMGQNMGQKFFLGQKSGRKCTFLKCKLFCFLKKSQNGPKNWPIGPLFFSFCPTKNPVFIGICGLLGQKTTFFYIFKIFKKMKIK